MDAYISNQVENKHQTQNTPDIHLIVALELLSSICYQFVNFIMQSCSFFF